MTTKVILLGCGPSSGVPQVGGEDSSGDWGACDRSNPKNRRLRSSLYIECEGKKILIDTGPDLRRQLLDNKISILDAVLYTHIHADHIMGIDELRAVCRQTKSELPIYGSALTLKKLQEMFDHCFSPLKNPEKIFRPHLLANACEENTKIKELPVVPFHVEHGDTETYGYRIGGVVYMPDVIGIPAASSPFLEDAKVWILDGYRYEPHFTHANIETALKWVQEYRPERAVFVNLGLDLDYEELKSRLPEGVEPGYDGMEIII